MARGTPWSHGDLLGAHLAFNLAGWFGTAIIGTLHTSFPSLTETQLRYPRLQRSTYILWLLGVVELAVGAAFTRGRPERDVPAVARLPAGWRRSCVARLEERRPGVRSTFGQKRPRSRNHEVSSLEGRPRCRAR